MVLLHHVSIHPHSLLFYKRTAPAAALRMLSSSTNPNPSLRISPSSMTKSNSDLPSKSFTFHSFPDSDQPLFASHSLSLYTSFANIANAIGATAAASGSVESPLVVVSFYKFADFPDHADLRKPLKALCERLVDSLPLPLSLPPIFDIWDFSFFM